MEAELIRRYASRMALVYTDKISGAKWAGLSGDYLKNLEDRKDFWEKVAQLLPDSEHWELVIRYINLDPKASKGRKRALYRFLHEAMKLNNSASQQAQATSINVP